MLVRIIAYEFLFLVRLRFPQHQSIAEIIRYRYSIGILKSIRKFEHTNLKHRKALIDLEFLLTCNDNGLISGNRMNIDGKGRSRRNICYYTTNKTYIFPI